MSRSAGSVNWTIKLLLDTSGATQQYDQFKNKATGPLTAGGGGGGGSGGFSAAGGMSPASAPGMASSGSSRYRAYASGLEQSGMTFGGGGGRSGPDRAILAGGSTPPSYDDALNRMEKAAQRQIERSGGPRVSQMMGNLTENELIREQVDRMGGGGDGGGGAGAAGGAGGRRAGQTWRTLVTRGLRYTMAGFVVDSFLHELQNVENYKQGMRLAGLNPEAQGMAVIAGVRGMANAVPIVGGMAFAGIEGIGGLFGRSFAGAEADITLAQRQGGLTTGLAGARLGALGQRGVNQAMAFGGMNRYGMMRAEEEAAHMANLQGIRISNEAIINQAKSANPDVNSSFFGGAGYNFRRSFGTMFGGRDPGSYENYIRREQVSIDSAMQNARDTAAAVGNAENERHFRTNQERTRGFEYEIGGINISTASKRMMAERRPVAAGLYDITANIGLEAMDLARRETGMSKDDYKNQWQILMAHAANAQQDVAIAGTELMNRVIGGRAVGISAGISPQSFYDPTIENLTDALIAHTNATNTLTGLIQAWNAPGVHP